MVLRLFRLDCGTNKRCQIHELTHFYCVFLLRNLTGFWWFGAYFRCPASDSTLNVGEDLFCLNLGESARHQIVRTTVPLIRGNTKSNGVVKDFIQSCQKMSHRMITNSGLEKFNQTEHETCYTKPYNKYYKKWQKIEALTKQVTKPFTKPLTTNMYKHIYENIYKTRDPLKLRFDSILATASRALKTIANGLVTRSSHFFARHFEIRLCRHGAPSESPGEPKPSPSQNQPQPNPQAKPTWLCT